MKKCKKCGVPLEGFLYKTIGKLMGIKPSDKDPEVCNKCAEDVVEPSAAPAPAPAKPAEQEPAAPVQPTAEEKKDETTL